MKNARTIEYLPPVPESIIIKEAIEAKREELNQAGNRFGLCSEYVLRKSKELDDLLNEYNKKSMIIRVAK